MPRAYSRVGAYWLPTNLCSVPLGIDETRLGSRSGSRAVLLRFYVCRAHVGRSQGLPSSQAIGQHAQESGLHLVLRPVMSEQMGLPIRSISRNGLLFHHASLAIHLCQVTISRLRST